LGGRKIRLYEHQIFLKSNIIVTNVEKSIYLTLQFKLI
jgi:hypothetical protein